MAIRNGLTAFIFFAKINRLKISIPLGEVVFLRRLDASVKRKCKRTSIQDNHIAWKIKRGR
jgi:hypothetical protein